METGSKQILDYFEELNSIPRCSGNEAAVGQWLMAWAQQQRLAYESDAAGNLVVRVPATPGYESSPTVVIQGHMDMVCEKTPESTHDFNTDPILSHMEGEWLTANGTTLGADNGIAIAYALVIAENDTVDHPPLELLFTVDEETGLNGVKELTPGFIQGRILINLDSEDEGVVTIGCAGGLDSALTLDLETAPVASEDMLYRLVVGGLKGGHSGIDIHKHRGNANKVIGRLLSQVHASAPIRLVALQGGTRKNAIARDAYALLAIKPSQSPELKEAVDRLAAILKDEYAISDSGLNIKLDPDQETQPSYALTARTTLKVIDLLAALPNGVAGMSATLEGLVETSSNLATVRLTGGTLSILSSQRSAIMSRLDAITAEVHAVGRLSGAVIEDRDGYPPWQPDMNSPLLRQSKGVYRKLFEQELAIQVIHAGLECAIIGDLYPGTDMISLGPTIRNPHSPDERIHLPSVDKVWRFLKALLKVLGTASG